MQQQSVQNGIDMRVSAIPLTPVRTRDRAPANGYISTPRSTSQHGNAARLAPKFEDIMDEQPDPSAMHHSSLPEDHLEDILALPIAAELRSRRSKTSLASDRTTSTTAFPSSSMPNAKRSGGDMSSNDISQDDGFNHHNEISLRDRRHDSLRKRSKSSPMRAESPSLGAADSSTAPVSRKQHPLRLEAATRPSDNKRDQLASSPAVGKGRYPPQTPPAPLTSKSRNRAVTNNVNNSATRKSPHLNSQSGGPRRPLQASSSTSNRQVSTPLKKFSSSTPPSTRARSSSTSLLSNSIQHDWDENSKPPWLEESPSYLYKSDIENIQPGSLADIARHAQGRSQTSQGADGDASLLGDTSVRSWDDVILPAVAKQIRAQQILEMQKNAQQCEDGKDDNLLVTHWNADGTPRKWQRLQPRSAGIAGTPASPNDSQVTEDSLAVISDGKPEGNSAGRFKTLSSGTLRQQEHQEPSSSSSSQQHLSVEQRLSQRSANSPTDSAGGKASSNMHNLEGREVWERNRDTSFNRPFSNEHSLLQTQEMNLSTNPQKPEPYHRDPDSGALRLQEGQMHQSQEQEQERETDTHKGGCCKCTIM